MSYIKAFLTMLLIMFGCCSQYSKKNNDSFDKQEQQPANIMKDRPQENLSPGTAKILSIIKELPDTTNIIKITVKSVLGYGMATRPIAPDTDMEVFLSEDLKARLSETDISEGQEVNLIISQEQGMQSEEVKWSVVNILQ